MTVEEMRAEFGDEWILVENPATNEALEVLSGTVVHHAKDREEVYRQAVSRRPKYDQELIPYIRPWHRLLGCRVRSCSRRL